MTVKKVELTSLSGDGNIGWIARAEAYFEVQNISEDEISIVKHACSTIHWFNLLRETKDGLTWDKQNWEMVTWFGVVV